MVLPGYLVRLLRLQHPVSFVWSVLLVFSLTTDMQSPDVFFFTKMPSKTNNPRKIKINMYFLKQTFGEFPSFRQLAKWHEETCWGGGALRFGWKLCSLWNS